MDCPVAACSLRERLALEREMLHCLALPGRKFTDGQIECLGTVDLECCFLGITAWIRLIFIGEWRINFAGFRSDHRGVVRRLHAAVQLF